MVIDKNNGIDVKIFSVYVNNVVLIVIVSVVNDVLVNEG